MSFLEGTPIWGSGVTWKAKQRSDTRHFGLDKLMERRHLGAAHPLEKEPDFHGPLEGIASGKDNVACKTKSRQPKQVVSNRQRKDSLVGGRLSATNDVPRHLGAVWTSLRHARSPEISRNAPGVNTCQHMDVLIFLLRDPFSVGFRELKQHEATTTCHLYLPT